MRQISIGAINDLSNGEIIPSFAGRVKKLWPAKTGESEHGPWLLQNMDVEDDTAEVKVTWGGSEPLEGLEGKIVTFESSETKHGLQGVKREIRTANGKTYAGVKLTGSCKIKVGDGTSPQSHGNAPKTAQATTPDVDSARRHIMQSVNLLSLCKAAADTVLGTACDPEDSRSLFIEASRAGLIAAMPTKPLSAPKEKAEAAGDRFQDAGEVPF